MQFHNTIPGPRWHGQRAVNGRLSAQLALLAVLLLPGFAMAAAQEPAEPPETGLDPDNLPPEMALSLDELLAVPQEGLEGVPQSRCLRRRPGVSFEILDAEHLLVKRSKNRAWLNKLRGRCVGMRPNMILVTESRGSGYCELDSVYATDRGGIGLQSGHCMLGKFEEITPQHADMLREAFKQQRGESITKGARAQRRAERKQARAAARAEAAAAEASKTDGSDG